MRLDRLTKLASFLYTLPEVKFDFSVVMNERGKPMLEALAAGLENCGTVACAFGWSPAVFPDELEWRDGTVQYIGEDHRVFVTASAFFDISYSAALYLFNPGGDLGIDGLANDLDEWATPQEVADHIMRFVRAAQ